MNSAPDTRTQIMDSFAEQLSTSGYLGASLLDVGRTVAIRRPSIYHHFPGGKEELYVAVATRFIEEAHDRIITAIATQGALSDKLTALVVALADRASHTVSFEHRVYEALDHVSDETKAAVSGKYVAGLLNPVVDLFTTAVEAGEVTGDPGFLMNTFLHLARATDLMDTPDGASRIVELFMNGARAR
ncbi:TetR/AcrR family transcriptional regulator [Dactylosporangium sp. NPDC051484]|uniref:TetR/AcrR family transcriptional regulator n=1 Tax=Dactylosporangium sp. NPDC051484 TaxID=3154942 RepID=UPI00344F2783